MKRKAAIFTIATLMAIAGVIGMPSEFTEPLPDSIESAIGVQAAAAAPSPQSSARTTCLKRIFGRCVFSKTVIKTPIFVTNTRCLQFTDYQPTGTRYPGSYICYETGDHIIAN